MELPSPLSPVRDYGLLGSPGLASRIQHAGLIVRAWNTIQLKAEGYCIRASFHSAEPIGGNRFRIGWWYVRAQNSLSANGADIKFDGYIGWAAY